MPEKRGGCGAGGSAQNSSRHLLCADTGLKWKSGECIWAIIFSILVGLWPKTALASRGKTCNVRYYSVNGQPICQTKFIDCQYVRTSL